MSQTVSKQQQIIEEVKRDPWATHQEIADKVNTERTYVTKVINETPGLRDVREAFQKGLLLDPGSTLAFAVQLDLTRGTVIEPSSELLTEVLMQRLGDGSIESMRVTFNQETKQ